MSGRLRQVSRRAGQGQAPAGWLDGELAVIRGELSRADDKCAVLAAVATGAAAFGVTQVGHGPLAARVTLTAAVVMFAAAVAALLRVLRPRLGTQGWCRFVPMSAEEIQQLATDGQDTGGTVRISDFGAQDAATLARLLAVRYRLLQKATDLALAGIVLLAIGGIATAIG